MRFIPEHFDGQGRPRRAFATVEDASRYRKSSPGVKRRPIHLCGLCGHYHLVPPSVARQLRQRRVA